MEPSTQLGRGIKRRRISAEQMNQMSRDEILAHLVSAVGELEAYDAVDEELGPGVAGPVGVPSGPDVVVPDVGVPPPDVNSTLTLILKELRAMRQERGDDRAAMAHLRRDNALLHDVVVQQQRFMEGLDSQMRDKNVVITGVPEGDPLDGAVSDEDKCAKILSVIGAQNVPVDLVRIGTAAPNKNRPILARTPCKVARDMVLNDTKALKNAGPAFRKIYVKKDMHPGIRREWKRLNDAEAAEKEKPTNRGCDIKLDYKLRVITRDGVVIDRWSPKYFV